MKIRAYLFIVTAVYAITASATNSIQTTDQELLASCQSLITTQSSLNSSPCSYFIQGFLASAQAIDAAIKEKQTKVKYTPYRTKGRTASSFMHFCIPLNEPNTRVIQTAVKQLPPQVDTLKALRENILMSLKAEYPCKTLN